MKRVINTNEAPAPVGPYNQAVAAGPFIFISGQIAIDPESGMLKDRDIRSETHQVIQNLIAILKAENMDLQDVVKCTIFIRNMDQYGNINQIYKQYFHTEDAPARELVEVSALPKGASIEISAIALKK
jgi:2-iminobutanoate/2-iminopropanoate deaminase